MTRRRIHPTALMVLALTLVATLPSERAGAAPTTVDSTAGGQATPDTIAYSADGDIWISDPGGARNLTGTAHLDERAPTWSPDGARIAYSAGNPDGGPRNIWVVGANGGTPWPLTTSEGWFDDPDWSPDGGLIAFSGGYTGQRAGIWVKAPTPEGGPTRRHYDPSRHLMQPAWSPVGSGLAMAAEWEGGGRSIVVVEPGGPWRQLTDGPYDYSPAWSPDGEQIAVSRRPAGADGDIMVLDSDGGEQMVNLTPGVLFDDDDPAWSSDGTSVLLTSRPGSSRAVDIHSVASDGSGGRHAVVATGMWELEPAVKPASGPEPCTEQTFELFGGNIQAVGCFARDGSAWVATGTVRMNGIDFTTAGAIRLDPDAGELEVAGDVTVSVGDVTLLVTGGLTWTLDAEVTLSLPGGFALKGFPIEGQATIAWRDGAAHLEVEVTMPEVLGGRLEGVSAMASLSADNADGLKLDEMSIGVERAVIARRVELKDVLVTYKSEHDEWKGDITVVLPTPNSVDLEGSLTLRGGSFYAGSVIVSSIGQHIANGVFLESIGFEVETDPLKLTGTAQLTAGPVIDDQAAARLDGALSYTFADPEILRVSGDLDVVEVRLADGAIEYLSSGRVNLEGHLGFEVLGIGVHGDLDGWIDGTKAFNIEGSASIGADDFSLAGTAVISDVGLAGCGTVFGVVSLGVGYKWREGADFLTGCDLGPYRSQGLQLVGDDLAFEVSEGLPVAAFAVTGETAAPLITLVGPDGRRISTSDGDGLSEDALVVTNDANRTTYLALAQPAGGRWMMEVAKDSSPIQSVRQSDGLPKPQVKAEVQALEKPAGDFVVSWDVEPLAGQKVTFAEVGPDTSRVIGTAEGESGKIGFTAGPDDHGKRSMVAMVEQDGLPRANILIGTY